MHTYSLSLTLLPLFSVTTLASVLHSSSHVLNKEIHLRAYALFFSFWFCWVTAIVLPPSIMANPYESGSSADPFREPVRPPAGAGVSPARSPPTSPPITSGASPISPQSYGSASAAQTTPPLGQGYNAAPYMDYSRTSPTLAGTTEMPAKMQFYSGEGAAVPPPPPSAGDGGAQVQQPLSNPDGTVPATPSPTSKFWTMEFYQQFFDVNTRQVLLRLSNTLVPLNPPDFLMDRNWHFNESVVAGGEAAEEPKLEEAGVVLSRKPDLYGPFWICTTLWITLAVVSNIMSKIAYTHNNNNSEPWKYDFSIASVAYLTVYLYCFVFGSLVWGIMQWKNLPATITDVVCLYGYSMFIFELVAILCMIPASAAQWVFVMVGGAWSTAYLLINMWHMWKTTLERNWFIGLVVFVTVFHMGLTMSFKFYFFKYKMVKK
jgi:protein YIPF1/2